MALTLLPGFAEAAEVRGRDLGDRGELAFEWDVAPDYRMRRDGDRVLVVFGQTIGEGAAQAFRRVGSYLEEGRVISGGSTILMVLQPTMELVDRLEGGTVFFEIRPAGAEMAAAPEPTPEQPAPASPEPEPMEPEMAEAVPLPMPELDLSATPAAPPPPMPALDLSPEVAATPEPEQERGTIRVRGGEHAEYSRIVFDWPEEVGYRAEQDGGNVLIAFEAAADADFARARPANLSRIDALRQIAETGPLRVAVAVPFDARLRHFRLGAKIVIDILQGDGTPAPVRAEAAPPPPTPLPPAPPVAARPEPEPDAVPEMVPAIAERDPETRIPHASVPVEDERVEPPAAATEPEQMAMAEDPSEPAEAVAERPVGEPLSLLPRRPRIGAEIETVPLEPLPVDPVARFDPGVPAALAVFQRGQSLWAVFASEDGLDANVLASQGSPALGSVDIVRAEGGIALRFEPDEEGEITVSRRGDVWRVAIEPAAIRSAETLDVVPQPDYPLGPRLLIEGATAQGLVRFADPIVGDTLIAAPVREPAVGIAAGARFAQLRLLPSVQGMVARPMSESLAMRLATDGVEVTDTEGLLLSASVDTAREVIAIAPPVDTEGRLLEVDVWRGMEGDDFIEQRQALQRALALAPEADRDRARLDFARFNFAHGYAQEALGLLDLVEESQPSIAGRESFLMLRGAARVLAEELEAAAEDLDHPGLAESRDAALWRAVSAAKSQDWTRAAAEFERAGRLIETYPRPFAELLARLAARTAIETGDPDAAEAQLMRIAALTDGQSERWASTHYLRGLMAEKIGDSGSAARAFEAAAASDDRFHRTLSELALIELDLAEGALDWEEAVATFESLRFAWRGDEIEFQLIDRIEGLYWQEGRYRSALETLQQASRSFPETPAGEAYSARLQARFVELFGSARVAAMAPLAAISLYHDFSDLMPDNEDGDRVLAGLAERLVEIDLLDQAGDILAELIETRLEGPDRARTGTRLAGIRLLSGQPGAALEALDGSQSDADALPALAPERRLLRAHAYAELGQAADALALLADDRRPIAAAARADIAWRGQDWRTAAGALAELVEPPPAPGTAMAEDQAKLVLNLGIALALSNDGAGLDRLGERYGSAMARSNSANTFAILTRSSGGTPQIADLAAVRQQVSEVDLFQNFLAGYRTAADPQS